jgi:ammonium transporter, Amt family
MPMAGVDLLWVIVASTLVMSMQTGFCMLEAGLVRSKNTINVAIKNLLDFCVAGIAFWAFGYALMFGASAGGWVGSTGWFFGEGEGAASLAHFIFQVMFCATAATIISGAVAERMSFRGYLWITLCVSGFIYPISGHWIWNSHGWLAQMGFVDFAGSTAVHSVGGWLSLAAVLVIGPRIGRFDSESSLASSHSLGTATFGVLILFVAWMGFNGGSTMALNDQVPLILLNTLLAGCAGGLAGLGCAWKVKGLPDLPDTLNGTVAGLVAVTAGCHVLSPAGSIVVGVIGGVACFYATVLLDRWRIDDVVGATAAHGVSGIWGTLAVALLGSPEKIGTGLGFWAQLGVQALGVTAVAAWAFGGGWLLLKFINRLHPLRVDAESERVGLNVAEHGASTEIIDLLTEMGRHREKGEFDRSLKFEPFTEVGQIASEYNEVIAKVAEEMKLREGIASRLRLERETAIDAREKIVASIEYAKRIQQAILPSESALSAALPGYFLMYRPRDMVSGDYYWCHRADDATFVAVVDCTGHGVPGAFMSLISHAILKQVVVEQNVREPDEILSRMHRLVREALGQNAKGGDNQDGMDMCLVRIDADKIVFSGAHRPLWWTRPPEAGAASFGEIKGTRNSLGGGRHEKNDVVFARHTLPRAPGLTIYLSSDGLVDQPNHYRQPFDKTGLRALLQKISRLSPAEQRAAIESALDAHCGGAAQRDDITLLGVLF